MATVEIVYGGQVYLVVNRTAEAVRSEIDGILLSGVPGWLEVRDGHGGRAFTHLLITPGLDVAVAPVPED